MVTGLPQRVGRRLARHMNGLASRNRYHQFDWQAGVPQPGELEYLGGCVLRHSTRTGFDALVRMPARIASWQIRDGQHIQLRPHASIIQPMNTKTPGTDRYAASRALNELDAKRSADDWMGDTMLLPLTPPADPDDTVPMLPALLQPQAE